MGFIGPAISAISSAASAAGPALATIGTLKNLTSPSSEKYESDTKRAISTDELALQKYIADRQLQSSDYNSSSDRNQRYNLANQASQDAFKTLGLQQAFQGGESQKSRDFEASQAATAFDNAMKQLTSQQGFQSGESQKGRDFEASQTATAFDNAMKQLTAQQGFQGAENQKGRDFESSQAATAFDNAMKQLTAQQGFQSGESSKTRDFQGTESQKDRQFQQDILNQKLAENKAIMGKGEALSSEGEKQFLNESAQAPSELQAYRDSIIKQSNPAQQAFKSSLTNSLRQQGVRGGQAGTLLSRGIGSFNNDLNSQLAQLMYQDASSRQNAKTNYFANKAITGQNRALTPTYGY